MSLLKYLRSKDGLPDPKGSLSTDIPERTISSANQQVQKAAVRKKPGNHTTGIAISKSCSLARMYKLPDPNLKGKARSDIRM